MTPIAGALEIAFAFCIVYFWQSLVPIVIAFVGLLILLVDVAVVMPALLLEAFNPVSLNTVSAVIAYIAYLTHDYSQSPFRRTVTRRSQT